MRWDAAEEHAKEEVVNCLLGFLENLEALVLRTRRRGLSSLERDLIGTLEATKDAIGVLGYDEYLKKYEEWSLLGA